MEVVGKVIGMMINRLDLEVYMMEKEIEFMLDSCMKERRLDLESSILLIITKLIIVVIL